VLIGALGIAGGYLIVSVAPVFAFVLIGNFVWALLDAGDTVAGNSIFQRRSPDHLRGRVFGAVGAGGLIANAVGFTFAGFLVEAFGPKGTYALCGIASLLVTPLLAPMFRALRSGEPSPESLG
jgi:MFS family permease